MQYVYISNFKVFDLLILQMVASTSINTFVSGLKSKNEDVRLKTAKELHRYIATELREMSQEDSTKFLDDFNHHIFDMVSSSDINDKKGGILAIGKHRITI